MKARITDRQIVYSGYVTVTTNRIRVGQDEFEREIVDQGDAAAVLPYDPARRTATLVRLLRAPVLARGSQDDLLEAPAGVVDPGEEALETARRELREETGLSVADLDHVGTVWSTPGVSAERVALYLAEYAPADRTDAGGGIDSENENITVVELPLAELIEPGRILDMKTLALVQALRIRRPELFASPAGTSARAGG